MTLMVTGIMEYSSDIACPACCRRETEQMPLDACAFFYDCLGFGTRLKPKRGDCCELCPYGSVKCSSMHAADGSCG
ncbi:MAG: GDCCVxC domain-containing (seleno)protein [Rhodospirillales bacterium]